MILRHNAVADRIESVVRMTGFRTAREHGGDLGDGRRPGDVVVFDWEGGRHLLVDVSVIHPTEECHLTELLKAGPGRSTPTSTGTSTRSCRLWWSREARSERRRGSC